MELIKFKCSNCNYNISAPENYAGKQVRCPKCKAPTRVPEFAGKTSTQEAGIIKFHCPNCNQKIGVTPDYAGKRVRCSKCKNPLLVPQAPSATARDETSAPRAGQEQYPTEQEGPGNLESRDELLFAKAPPAERQTEQGPADYGAGVNEFSEARLPTSGLPAEGEAIGTLPKKRRSIIFIVAGGVLGLLLAVIVVWSFISSSDTSENKMDAGLLRAQKFAEDYIGLLNKGEIDKARKLLGPGLQTDAEKGEFERLVKYISKSKIEELRLRTTNVEEHPEGNQFYFYYSFRYKGERHRIALSVVEINKELRIGEIAAQEPFGSTISIGPHNFEELRHIAMASSVAKFESIFTKFFCGFILVVIVAGLVQFVSVWIVFEKAGEHGWAALIPGYNMWVLAEIGGKPGWLGLLMFFSSFIPYIGPLAIIVLSIVISIGVAKAFGRGAGFGVGLALVPIVFYPILAFASD